MFSWLKKLVPTTLGKTDPTFGSMTYMGGYWEASAVFPPSGEEVEYFITADERGPTSESYSNFDLICSHFGQLQSRAMAAISSAVQDDGDLQAAKVSSIDIPAESLAAAAWEIGFTTSTGALYSVAMSGYQAAGKVEVS